MTAHSDAAREWLRNYHGSIDSTALLLAFDAGHQSACSLGGLEDVPGALRLGAEGYAFEAHSRLLALADHIEAAQQ